MKDWTAKASEAAADLIIAFLPILLVVLVLWPLGRLNSVNTEFSFLIAILFTDGAWRARSLPTGRPTERWSCILIGCFLGLGASIAGTFHLLIDQGVIVPMAMEALEKFASQADSLLFPIAIVYGFFVRYKCA